MFFSGKTSLIIQFIKHEFIDYYDPTIENSKYIILKSNCILNLVDPKKYFKLKQKMVVV